MVNSKIPRRVFLHSLGLMTLVSGCSAEWLTLPGQPTATPLPAPTLTPLPRADAVAQTYLNGWVSGDYDVMYSLLTPTSQARLSSEQFYQYYQRAMGQATAQKVEAQLHSLLHEGPQAAATFRSVWQTLRFGPLQADNQMRLKFEEGRWGIEWQPTLVLPHLGENITLAFLNEQPTRGNIYDKAFHALATQGQLVTVGVVPQFITDQQAVVSAVAGVTQVGSEKIIERINGAQPDWFVPIADIDFETSVAHDDLFSQLAGIERRARMVRSYNNGDTAAHLIGYIGHIPAEKKDEYIALGYGGDEWVGLSGVEAWAEADLAGQRGGRLVTLSPPPGREVLAELATATAQAGSSVYLTIDTPFQVTVEQLLGQRRGAVVVMDAANGAIQAMATYPRFEPAAFTREVQADIWASLSANPERPLVNRATQGSYPPGSIFKIVSLAAALEGLKLDPELLFTCNGKWQGLGAQFEKECWLKSGHGQIKLIDALTQSCNVVFYEVGLALHRHDPELLPGWARTFGLGQLTYILGLHEESAGIIPDRAWMQTTFNQPLFDGDAVNTGIGQGFTLVTPIQMARLLAAIGNGGQLVRPRLIERVVAVAGSESVNQADLTAKLPLSAQNLKLIQESLKAITSGAQGTARHVFEGVAYTVAGKTGTAESGQGEPHAWFTGYAPADTPRVAIAVVVEQAGEGSKVAAPLFRQVLEAFFEWEAHQS